MAPPKSNRIEVDLQLMQAEAIDKLQKFGKDFNNTVDRLADLLDNAASNLAQAPGTGGPGIGPSASTAAQTDQMMQGVDRARQGGADNIPSGANYGSAGGPSDSRSVEQQMISFQRRVGTGEMAIPVGLRQLSGYIAEGVPIAPPNFFDRSYWQRSPEEMQQGVGRFQAFARRANDIAFSAQALKANVMLGMNKYAGFWGGIQNISNAGYNVNPNASRAGWFGSTLFSSAFAHGLNETLLSPLISSDFGLNPSYSLGQAQQARQAINQYGWSTGNMGDWLSQVLKENTIKNGVDPMTQMAVLDPALRWGGNSFQQLNSILQQIPSAANAAGYNLQQFTQSLVQTSQQVAMQTGIPIGTVMQGIQTISATTGLSPEQAAPMMNMQSVLMASGMTGKKPWDIMFGPNQQAVLSRPLTVFQNVLGMPIKEWEKGFYRSRPGSRLNELAKQRMMYADFLYQTDPQIFGGLAPFQAAHILGQAGSIGGLIRQGDLQNRIDQLREPNTQLLDAKIEAILGDYYRHNPSRNEALVKQYIQGAGGRTMAERKTLAERLIRAYQPMDRRNHAKYVLGLTPDAKKLVQLMGSDPGHANSGGGFGRWALNASESIVNSVPVVGGIAQAFGF